MHSCVRQTNKLKVRSDFTFQVVVVTQMLLDGLDEGRVRLAPALMNSPVAANHMVNVVYHFASRWTCCCLQLSIDCLSLVPLVIVPLLTHHNNSHTRQ